MHNINASEMHYLLWEEGLEQNIPVAWSRCAVSSQKQQFTVMVNLQNEA